MHVYIVYVLQILSYYVNTYVHTYVCILLIFLQRPNINPCTTLPVACYYIHVNVTFMNGSQIIYSSNCINDTVAGTMGRVNVRYNDIFDVELEPNANYNFTVNFSATQRLSPPPRSPSSKHSCV